MTELKLKTEIIPPKFTLCYKATVIKLYDTHTKTDRDEWEKKGEPRNSFMKLQPPDF